MCRPPRRKGWWEQKLREISTFCFVFCDTYLFGTTTCFFKKCHFNLILVCLTEALLHYEKSITDKLWTEPLRRTLWGGSVEFEQFSPAPPPPVIAETGTGKSSTTTTRWERHWTPRPGVPCATSTRPTPSPWSANTASASGASGTCGASPRTARTTVRSGGVRRCTTLCPSTGVW